MTNNCYNLDDSYDLDYLDPSVISKHNRVSKPKAKVHKKGPYDDPSYGNDVWRVTDCLYLPNETIVEWPNLTKKHLKETLGTDPYRTVGESLKEHGGETYENTNLAPFKQSPVLYNHNHDLVPKWPVN